MKEIKIIFEVQIPLSNVVEVQNLDDVEYINRM